MTVHLHSKTDLMTCKKVISQNQNRWHTHTHGQYTALKSLKSKNQHSIFYIYFHLFCTHLLLFVHACLHCSCGLSAQTCKTRKRRKLQSMPLSFGAQGEDSRIFAQALQILQELTLRFLKNHTALYSTWCWQQQHCLGWFGHLVPPDTNITSCMPRRPRHFPICLKPIKGMSLTTSQAVSVALLYRLHDDALMSKTKEFLQPHWGVGILLFGASLARHINQFTRWAPKIHQSLSTSSLQNFEATYYNSETPR